jgi:hypothetical protein
MAALFKIANNKKGDLLHSCGIVASSATSPNGKKEIFFLYLASNISASLRVICRGSKRFGAAGERLERGMESWSPKNSAWWAWSSSTPAFVSGTAIDGRLRANSSLKTDALLLSAVAGECLGWHGESAAFSSGVRPPWVCGHDRKIQYRSIVKELVMDLRMASSHRPRLRSYDTTATVLLTSLTNGLLRLKRTFALACSTSFASTYKYVSVSFSAIWSQNAISRNQ